MKKLILVSGITILLVAFIATIIFPIDKQDASKQFVIPQGEYSPNITKSKSRVLENFIGILKDSEGNEIIEPCFANNPSENDYQIEMSGWKDVEFYTWISTARFKIPKSYTLIIDDVNRKKEIDTNIEGFGNMGGSLTPFIEDFMQTDHYILGYRNDYAVGYAPEIGWFKQYIQEGQYTDFATCIPNEFRTIKDRDIYMTSFGDAGFSSHTYFVETNGNLFGIRLGYVGGGDAASGLNIPENSSEIVSDVTQAVLAILGTASVATSTR